MAFADLRAFIDDLEQRGELTTVLGAHWQVEIGGITEIEAMRPNSRAILFDEVPGYPKGFRILTNPLNAPQRYAPVMGLTYNGSSIDLIQSLRQRLRQFQPVPPREVADGPVLENVDSADTVDVLKFPAPQWHELDGGRYIGTGCAVITRDPETGWVNAGTYRVQVHDSQTVGVYMSPGRHGELAMRKHWQEGRCAPVAISVGHDPTFFITSSQFLPPGESEYGYAGWLRGEPVDVLTGRYSGLPIPATAEIVLEGDCPPPESDSRTEGPFGEWQGYYASEARARPIVRVRSVSYRNDPIILGIPPIRPPVIHEQGHLTRAALIWDHLERSGITGVSGVWQMPSGGPYMTTVIALRQSYAGAAKQAALSAIGSRAGGYMVRYVIIVDDDIDPSNQDDVLWAVNTRCVPETDIDIVRGIWATPLDPSLPPAKRDADDYTSSVAIIDATRPFAWRKQFPTVNALSAEGHAQILQKWSQSMGWK
jgi:4-hydroxy-3-polyprenylbenzoate decarboxylase